MIAEPLFVLGLLLLPCAMAQVSVQPVLPTSSIPPVPSVARTTLASVAGTSSIPSPAPTGPPALALPSLGTMQACGTARLNWQLQNVDANLYTVTFRAHNSGVNQVITSASATTPTSSAAVATTTTSFAPVTPPSLSVSATTTRPVIPGVTPSSSLPATNPLSTAIIARSNTPIRRSKLAINQTMGTNSAAFGYSMPVMLPEGRYILIASVPQLKLSTSMAFTVIEGADKSCLASFAAQSADLSSTVSSTAVPSASGSLAAANNGESASNGGVSTGAIAGAVAGVLAGLAIVGLLAFCLVRRRRMRDTTTRGPRRDMMESEKTFRVGGMGTKRSISRPQRLPSETDTSPPSSRSSHGPQSDQSHPTSAAGFAAAYNSSMNSSRELSSNFIPYTPTSHTPPRLPETATLGVEHDYDDPFATPGLLSNDKEHRSVTSARPKSQAEPSRRASSPVPAFTSPFGPFTSAGTAYPAPATQSLSRSLSLSDPKRPSPPGSTAGEGMVRKGSTKRKAVPSLGPELRKQMEKNGGVVPAGPGGSGGKKQFTLIPDMPGPPTRR